MKSLSPNSFRRVLHEGIRYENSIYFNVDLVPYQGTKVIVHKDKNGLQVFNAHGKRICIAEEVTFSSAAPVGGKRRAV